MFVPKARIHFYFCNACLQITSAVELSAGLAVVMSDLWQSRLNCTNAKCTVSTEFNSRCLKNLRVESGITKLKVKLNHHSICLHICLCSSESAKQLLQPLTLTRHAANLPSVCHDALRARDWALVRSQMCILLAHTLHLRPLGHSCPAPIPAFDPLPLSEAMEVQDILVFIPGTSFWKYHYDDSHKQTVKCWTNILWGIPKRFKLY